MDILNVAKGLGRLYRRSWLFAEISHCIMRKRNWAISMSNTYRTSRNDGWSLSI